MSKSHALPPSDLASLFKAGLKPSSCLDRQIDANNKESPLSSDCSLPMHTHNNELIYKLLREQIFCNSEVDFIDEIKTFKEEV